MSEHPAEIMHRAAVLMHKRAEEATPGPWERPLDTRYKSIVGAALPEDEQGRYIGGVIPDYATGYSGRYRGQRERCEVVQCNTWSDGSFTRERSGRDLEYIASMHPIVAVAVAEWLDAMAVKAEGCLGLDTPEGPCCAEPSVCGGHDPEWGCDNCGQALGGGYCSCGFNEALAVARAYLGEQP